MDEKKSKSLAEMSAEAAKTCAAMQWRCPRCGGLRWWVVNSYFVASDNTRHRKRECRTCHQVLYTRESINGQ